MEVSRRLDLRLDYRLYKLGVIAEERLKIEVKLLLSANRKSYIPRRLAQQRMTLGDLECLFHASRAISAVAELLVRHLELFVNWQLKCKGRLKFYRHLGYFCFILSLAFVANSTLFYLPADKVLFSGFIR